VADCSPANRRFWRTLFRSGEARHGVCGLRNGGGDGSGDRPTLGGWITDNFTWRWIFFINIPVGILSILLTSRLIQDPPYFKRRKLSETSIDYVGLGFVALGLGALQIVLDKGQRDDWFESHFIVILSLIAVAALIFVVIWEWRHKDPIIDLHLFRDRTFGVSNLLMFMLGFALLGSTLLLPLFCRHCSATPRNRPAWR
jgi:DHA2 family multidrug resistance protein